MGKKVNHFTVTVKGEEVVIKCCTGCGKNKALSEYSKGVALFGRQAKCKSCNKEEYAAKKATIEYDRMFSIRFIEEILPYVKYTGHTGKDADIFINIYFEFALEKFEENLKLLKYINLGRS